MQDKQTGFCVLTELATDIGRFDRDKPISCKPKKQPRSNSFKCRQCCLMHLQMLFCLYWPPFIVLIDYWMLWQLPDNSVIVLMMPPVMLSDAVLDMPAPSNRIIHIPLSGLDDNHPVLVLSLVLYCFYWLVCVKEELQHSRWSKGSTRFVSLNGILIFHTVIWITAVLKVTVCSWGFGV